MQQVGAAPGSKAFTVPVDTTPKLIPSDPCRVLLTATSNTGEELVEWAGDPPCDGKGLVKDPGSGVGNGELVPAEQGVALPRKDGVVTETAEDGVAEGEEENLKRRKQSVAAELSTSQSDSELHRNAKNYNLVSQRQQTMVLNC